MRRPEWLTRESEGWEAEGLISTDQRRAILDRYSDQEDAQVSARALVWLAWLVAGFGLILLVSWNWTAIPGPVRVGGTQLLAACLYAMAWRTHTRGTAQGSRRTVEWLAFAGALAVGAAMVALTEAYEADVADFWPMLSWAAVIAVTAVIVPSPVIVALGAAALTFWAMSQTGDLPAPWAYLLVFPLLALSLERRPNPYAAGAVTLAFCVWVTLVGLDTWGSAITPGFMLLVSGAAIDTWAHAAPGRRPAFASTTPALAMVVIGLWFTGMAGLNEAALPPLAQEPGAAWLGLALVASLLAVSLWPSQAQRAARWRPAVFGGLAVACVISIAIAQGGITGSARPPAPVWWSWLWALLASLALVMVTVSTVREGVASSNRALFVVGVGAMVALVSMHLNNDNANLGRSALVLFTAAGVLWWVSRPLLRKT